MTTSTRTLLAAVLIAFTGILIWAMASIDFSVPQMFDVLFASPVGSAAVADLLIALSLVSVWLYHDAKRLGRSPWLWVVLTFVLGSPGPLLYLLTRRSTGEPKASAPFVSEAHTL